MDGDNSAVSGVSVTGATQLDTDGTLWLGGSQAPPKGLPEAYMTGFNGCIESVAIEGNTLDLLHHRLSVGQLTYC